MNTQKVAITMPTDLLTTIDDISKQKGMSRSRYISNILREKVRYEKVKQIKASYNRVFSDELILREQIETATWLEGSGNKEGQEW